MASTDLLGTLVVVVLKAKELPDKHTFSKQDPFAQIKLGSGKPQRTKADLKGGQHPLWDEEFRVDVPRDSKGKNRTLEIHCYAQEPRGEELIGQADLDITETLKTGEFDDWVKLSNNNTQRGMVYLEMTFYAAGPAPLGLNRRPTKMKPSERLHREGGKTEVGLPAFNGPSEPPNGSTLKPEASPPPKKALLTPPSLSPHGSRSPSPRRPEPGIGPLRTPSQEPAIPTLLRAGHPHSPPRFVQETKPLPPNDPLNVRRSDPSRVASPPIGASAYPPASPPVPSSLFPARPSPGLGGSFPGQTPGYGGIPIPTHSPSPSPAPAMGHYRSLSGGVARVSPPQGPGGFAFPVAQVSEGPNFPASYGHGSPAANFPVASTPVPGASGPSPYGAPNAPAMPGSWSYENPSSGYQTSGPDYSNNVSYGPLLPDPYERPLSGFAQPAAPIPAESHISRAHPTMAMPGMARMGSGFRIDDSDMATPKADFQPRHSPAVPTSHLRQEAVTSGANTPLAEPRAFVSHASVDRVRPDVGRYGEYSAYAGAASNQRNAADRDAEAAREFERQEREAATRAATRAAEQEEKDMELARRLDFELNASER